MGVRTVSDIDPLEEQREFVLPQLNARRLGGDLLRETEGPRLQALAQDGEPASRPPEQSHLSFPPVEEHKDVPAQRVMGQCRADLNRETIERLPQIRRLRGDVDLDGARQEDHGVPRSAATRAASQRGSRTTPSRNSRATPDERRNVSGAVVVGMLSVAGPGERTTAGTREAMATIGEAAAVDAQSPS